MFKLCAFVVIMMILVALPGTPVFALSFAPGADELYGRVGDPGVVLINGRTLSVRILLAISEGSWGRYLSFWDITNLSSIWGDVKPLNSGGGQVTMRDLSGKGGRYVYRLEPQSNDLALTLVVAGATEEQTISIREIAMFSLKQAVARNWVVQLGNASYYLVPQACSAATILKGPGECGKSLLFYAAAARGEVDNPISDFRSLNPQYMVDLVGNIVPIGSSGFGLSRDANSGAYQLIRLP